MKFKIMKKLFLVVLFGVTFSSILAQCLPLQDNVLFLDNWDDDSLFPTSNQNAHFNDIWGYAAEGREYGIIGGRDSIFIIDVSVPTDIERVVGIYQGDTSSWRDFKVFDHYLYSIVDRGNQDTKGVVVYDLSGLPSSVSKVKEVNSEFGRCHNIYVDAENARLYAVGIGGVPNLPDICVYDLTDPADPTSIGCYDLDTIAPGSSNGLYIHDVFVKDNIAYCGHGYSGYYVWDFNNLDNVSLLGSLDGSFFDNGYVHSSWNTENDKYAIVATEVGDDPKLYWVDQSNFALMSIEETFKEPLCVDVGNTNRKTPHNPYLIDDKIYVSHYHDGVQVLEIDDVDSSLSRVGYYDTFIENSDYSAGYLGNWGVYPFLPSGTIIASDRRNGLFTLKYEVFTDYVFVGPGTDWNTASNWQGSLVPPIDFTGRVTIQSNCIRPSGFDPTFIRNEIIIVKDGVSFTQE